MKAVGYKKSLPVDAADALIDFETAKPEPKGRDIRVAVKAISANPVDYKVRKRAAPAEGETKILGYDAAGIVDAVGPDVTLGLDVHELNRWSAGQSPDQALNMARLPQRQCRRARTDSECAATAHASSSIMNRYPTPHTVWMYSGFCGSRSILERKRLMCEFTV